MHLPGNVSATRHSQVADQNTQGATGGVGGAEGVYGVVLVWERNIKRLN